MKELKYTARVTGLGSGPVPDAFDTRAYNIVDLHIPSTEGPARDIRTYIKGQPPAEGELVDVTVVESLGFIDQVKSIETKTGRYPVISHDI
ncbi:MAG: hypothetical protein J7K54_03075 [Candidatus Aenigmarchaeota archaeon]|nr:hypothetical protein [Candidatus Aenigmarchaeota archaeon]